MAGLLWYRSYMDSLANTSGYYPDIHAGRADRVAELTLEAPYLVRETPAGYNQLELMKLVGGSVAWNQLAQVRSSYSATGVTLTVDGNSEILSGTATQVSAVEVSPVNLPVIAGHKYYVTCMAELPENTYLSVSAVRLTGRSEGVLTYNQSYPALVMRIDMQTGAVFNNLKVTPQYTDLTQMLGPTIADYVYSLEQATAGSGIAWLKSYDLIDDQYHAFSNLTLEHVKTTAHITKDADDNVLDTSQLDSGLVLRGVLKLDNGALVYDGDTYEPDGTVTRYFGIRAYQAGDESLTDAITDGTNTVYKLNTPTTESVDPFTAVQTVEDGGTEEFVTSNSVPVGNVSVYRRA